MRDIGVHRVVFARLGQSKRDLFKGWGRKLFSSLKARIPEELLPLRDELLSIEQLDRYAREMAGSHLLIRADERRGRDRVLARLAENSAFLRDAYEMIADAAERGRRITPAAEWFLDNYPLIDEHVRIAKRDLPPSYSRELPALSGGRLAGYPRVYAIAEELISHADGRVDTQSLSVFLKAYQSVTPLRLGELWAIPLMLRLALLENLRRVVARVVAGRRDRENATRWTDRLCEVAARAPAEVVVVLAEMVRENPPLSTAFVSEFTTRIQGKGATLAFPITWMEQRLSETGQTVEAVFQQASQSQAADQVSIGNSIGSLRFLAATEWRGFVESISGVEQILRTEPAGVYPRMDFRTRDRYRHAVEGIARVSTSSEIEIAKLAVQLAGEMHVGSLLIGARVEELERGAAAGGAYRRLLRRMARKWALPLYLGVIVILTIAVSTGATWWMGVHVFRGATLYVWIGIVLLCSSQLAVALTQWAAMIVIRPRLLPRMDFSSGISADHRTIVAVPTLISDEREIDDLLDAMEVRFLANRDEHLCFALLTDFPDAEREHLPGDAALFERVRAGIEALNEKYGHVTKRTSCDDVEYDQAEIIRPFYLFHRGRRWNEGQNTWMGWERKRGKLEAFNDALRGMSGGFDVVVGAVELLPEIKFVIALDSDTQLPRGAGRELAATLSHPMNLPRFSEKEGRVVEGFGILQPRVGISMPSANRSRFAQLFAGEAGIDPYTHAVSDVYQELFGEGSFIGKGIYDVDAVRRSLRGRLPENRILSHDLLEGGYARSGFLSDVLLVEEFPSTYTADVSRRYRWIRGDWQIASWTLPWVPGPMGRLVRNPISRLSRWKVLDNLRRSLMPMALMALLLWGWATPGEALRCTLLVIGAVILPGLLNGAVQLARKKSEDLTFTGHIRLVAHSVVRQLMQQVFTLACLPSDAMMSAQAICRTAFRLIVSRRNLLQWRTARTAQRSERAGMFTNYREMWAAPTCSVVVAGGLGWFHPEVLKPAGPILALWLLVPAITYFLSKPKAEGKPELTADDILFLEKVARRTWRFFETFVTAEDHYLPPDNFQEDLTVGIAHRTSPTNIGLSLLSTLTAYDFGYITATEMVERTSQTLATLDKLQRHREHFYNWYDTRTLEPLMPLYVSTVDSGNLAGHLLVLATGLEELAVVPISGAKALAGLRVAIDLLLEVAREPQHGLSHERLAPIEVIRDGLTVSASEAEPTLEMLRKAEIALNALRTDLPATAGSDLRWWNAAAIRHCRLHREEIEKALNVGDAVVRRAVQLRQLAGRCRALADMQYGFLYDKSHRLLSIGFNVSDRRLETGFYDLLASEARLTSFIGIAQEKLPGEHWFNLGRSVVNAGEGTALVSWSGSMFEYLMPLLVMPTYERTLLDETYRAVVRRQVEYGAERGVPWGISESGYTKTDAHGNYQYLAFGVPGLGFKRGLANDLVVAPYASALALMVDPVAACANLRRLATEGLLQTFGFYEAVDYSPARLRRGQTSAPVRSFMSHHQGMALLSLNYLLNGRPMQRRFDADAAFRATDLLLQERAPKFAPVVPLREESVREARGAQDNGTGMRVFSTAQTSVPEVHLLSNGRYHVALTAAGGGYSRWGDLAVTRWREDPTRDCWGTFCYVRDVDSGEFWSVAQQPTAKTPDTYEAIYSQGRADFRRVDGEIETLLEVAVSPEDDIEIRRISITNRGSTPRRIELTSYAEVVLAPPAADAAHPAFSNLFVQTEIVRPRQAILCTRRPRSAGERAPWMLHLMTVHGESVGTTSYETSRDSFIGRGRSVADPMAMHGTSLTDSEGAVLDPVVAIRNTLVIRPDETVRMHLVTGASETKDAAMAVVEKYDDPHSAARVFELAWTQSQVVLRQLDAAEADTQLFGRLASSILYANASLRADTSVISRNRRGQSALWAYGISGDLPIVLLRCSDQSQMQLVRQLVQAHSYWRAHGLAVDLLIWNEDQSNYRQELQERITEVISSQAEIKSLDKPGGIFLRRSDQISEEDRVLMQAAARVIISDSAGTLADQVDRQPTIALHVPALTVVRDKRPATKPAEVMPPDDVESFNGFGGFSRDGREYVIVTTPESRTPAPWVNVLANPWFGSVVSESGSAYTWCENAHSYRITPWNNDAVTDISGEAFYVRDEETGRFWSPTPLPARGRMPYVTRHGFGYSTFEYTGHGISTHLRVHVATDAPVKVITIKFRNTSGKARRLSITGYVELQLGDRRAIHAPYIVTEVDAKTGALFARNAYNGEFSERVVFFEASDSRRTVTGDRREFLGRNGTPARPASMSRARLSGRVGAGLDPCAAIQVAVDLADGQEREVVFLLGSGRNTSDARELVGRFRGLTSARTSMSAVTNFWEWTLGAVKVETPDASVNALANGWLLYQVIASRIWGRSGYYQSGGAFGFRDQLQDAMALIHARPAMIREQILRCAAHQFPEGDVQHWWHPPSGRGVRTRISDDYLWLPFVTCKYVAALGDTGVLGEQVPFIEGRAVNADEDSYYDLPSRSAESATLYVHCVRAIRHGLTFGDHGLPLMGCGDWNDGMNLVGEHGKGESVWLAFFLYDVLKQFAPLARRQSDPDFADFCEAEAEKLRMNIELHGWDGQWYRRAYFDNGEPLGSASNPECQIDSIPQSWSVLSGAGDPARSSQAMASVNAKLVRRDIGIIQLFDPPFNTSSLDPGYVKGYVPGVRENGGQYTHAAIWTVMAFAAAGEAERAWELFQLINPTRHGESETAIRKYKVEPYVVAADVYANPLHAGRGGWTWYTGSAGWMYRLLTESFLGLHLQVDCLCFAPCMPKDWASFKVRYRYRETYYDIVVRNLGSSTKISRLRVDGVASSSSRIKLADDRQNHIVDLDLGLVGIDGC